MVGRWDLLDPGLKGGSIVATDSADKGLRFLTSLRYVRNDSLGGALISESLWPCEATCVDENWAAFARVASLIAGAGEGGFQTRPYGITRRPFS